MNKLLTLLLFGCLMALLPLLSTAQNHTYQQQTTDTVEVYDPSTNVMKRSIIITNKAAQGVYDTIEVFDPKTNKSEIRVIQSERYRKIRKGGRSGLNPELGAMQEPNNWYRTPEENEMNIRKYKKNRNLGIGLLIGGAVVSGIGASVAVLSFVEKDGDDEYRFTDEPKPLPLIAGAGTFMLGTAAMTTGTVLTIINSVKIARANKEMRRYGSLDLSTGKNGLGLCLNF